MKKLILILMLGVATQALARPALVLIDRSDSESIANSISVIRDHGSVLFVATETSSLPAGTRFEVLDTEYNAGHYLLVRGAAHATDLGFPILWQDEAGALVKLPQALAGLLGAQPGVDDRAGRDEEGQSGAAATSGRP